MPLTARETGTGKRSELNDEESAFVPSGPFLTNASTVRLHCFRGPRRQGALQALAAVFMTTTAIASVLFLRERSLLLLQLLGPGRRRIIE